MHARVSEDLDLSMEQGFEVLTQTDEIEQRTSSLHVDKEVDVAAPVVLAEVRDRSVGRVRRTLQPVLAPRKAGVSHATPNARESPYELSPCRVA